MSETKKISVYKAGGIKFQSVVLKNASAATDDPGINLTPFVQNVNIYLSFSNVWMSGEMFIKDDVSLASSLPLKGDESIFIDATTPGFEDSSSYNNNGKETKIFSASLSSSQHRFFVHKMSNKVVAPNSKVAGYILSFISYEAIKNKNTVVSQSFKGNPLKIVQTVCQTFLSTPDSQRGLLLNTDNSPTNDIAFVSNYWSPSKIIKYVCEHSTDSHGCPGYVFYETIGGLNFQSLYDLLQQPAQYKLSVDKYTRTPHLIGGLSDIVKQYNTVQSITIHPRGTFDFDERKKNGLFGGRTITFDITTGRYIESTSVITELKNQPWNVTLNGTELIAESAQGDPSSNIQIVPTAFNTFDNIDYHDNRKIKTQRQSFISRLYVKDLFVTVAGRFDYAPGQVVQIDILKDFYDKDNPTGKWDYMSGKYLIVAVRHMFGIDNHITVLELFSDSVAAS